jgi:hypothetical protein
VFGSAAAFATRGLAKATIAGRSKLIFLVNAFIICSDYMPSY